MQCLQRIPQEKKGDHYSPNEICSMIYETHLSCKVQPLSRAVYLKRDTGFSERNQLHIIPQPKMHTFNPKLVSFGKDSAELSLPAARYVTRVAVRSVIQRNEGQQLPKSPAGMPEPLQQQVLILLPRVWPSAVKGQELFLLGWVLSPGPLQAWRRRRTFPAWRDPTQPAAPGAGRTRRGVGCAPGWSHHRAGTSVGTGSTFALPPHGTRGLIHHNLQGRHHTGTRWAVRGGVHTGQRAVLQTPWHRVSQQPCSVPSSPEANLGFSVCWRRSGSA